MNILTKLTLRFSIITASILVLFSLAVYLFSASYRKEEFYQRLESRAVTTAKLLVTVKEVDKALLRIIDDNSVPALPEEQVFVFDKQNRLAYSSTDDTSRTYSNDLLNSIRQAKKMRFEHGDFEEMGAIYLEEGEPFVVVASAFDRYGKSKLGNLRTIMLLGLPIGIGIIVLAGRIFAEQVLNPLANINDSVSKISEGNLDQRLDEGNQTDEIARLAMNFNQMLERLEKAFELQQSFVANASHELRTPLAAMRSQLQVELGKVRNIDEYQSILQSQLDDVVSLSDLTNRLLLLARTSMEQQRLDFSVLRVDEVLFNAQEELARLKPAYRFHFDYNALPDNEADLTVRCNEQLLTVAFLNLMDNACKFSEDKTVTIAILAQNSNIQISFQDKGPGIAPNDLEQVFQPFYQGENVRALQGATASGFRFAKESWNCTVARLP
ncbi:MAG: HAMP domain-containing protein [Saprospiraceae bacterium]|nr:HAMP domain-containing protein [Saprospiraceae bacterium]